MKQGKHEIKTQRRSRKRPALLVALALLLCLTVGATVAWITTNTAATTNTFTPGSVSCAVEESFSGSSKTAAQIKNTGNTDAYIRAAVVANSVDAQGNITGAADVTGCLYGNGWTVGEDGYYYYTVPVAPDASTGNLLKSGIDLTGKQVTILAEAIQSEPAAAREAAGWGWSPSAN